MALSAPPTWKEIEGDESFQALPLDQKRDTLNKWNDYSKAYSTEQGWDKDEEFGKAYDSWYQTESKKYAPPLLDTVKDVAASIGRGATDSYMGAAEGLYRMAGSTVTPFDRDEYLSQEAQSAQNTAQQIQDSPYMIPAAREAGVRGQQERGLEAAQEIQARNTEGTPEFQERIATEQSGLSRVGNELLNIADESGRQRETVRQYLPVSDSLQNTIPGQIAQGLGQLSSLPLYAIPGVGPAVSVGQLYQEGYDDAVQNGASPEQARDAAAQYTAAAAPLDIITDKLIVGRALKGMVGKTTIREALKDIGGIAIKEGAAEGGQQAALNLVASNLSGYNPDRPLTEGVLNSVIVGSIVGGLGGAAAQGAGAVSRPQQVADVTNTVIAENAGEQVDNLTSNNAPLTALAVTENATDAIETVDRNARTLEILEGLGEQPTEQQGDERFSPPAQAVIREAQIEADNLYTEDPDQAGQSSLRDWRATLPPEVASNTQAHGAPISSIQAILEQGVNPDQPFYTAPLSDSGEGSLGLRDTGTGGQVLLLGQPGQNIKDSGVKAVVVNDYLAPSLQKLQDAYPQVTWLTTQNATQWLNDQQSTRLDEPANQAAGETQGTQAGEEVQTPTTETKVSLNNTQNELINRTEQSNFTADRNAASEQAQARNASILQAASEREATSNRPASSGESQNEAILRGVESVNSIPAQDIEQFPVKMLGTMKNAVRHDTRTDKAIKTLLPRRYGMTVDISDPENPSIRNGTLEEYLNRIALFNKVFDSDITIEGVTRPTDPLDDNLSEGPALVTSQTWEYGTTPTESEVTDYMQSLGFQPGSRGHQWIRPEDGIYVADARPDNFVKTDNGVQAIDLLVSQQPTQQNATQTIQQQEGVPTEREAGNQVGEETIPSSSNSLLSEAQEQGQVNETPRDDSGAIPETLQPAMEEGTGESSQATAGTAPSRVQIGSSPQTHEVIEELPQTPQEQDLGERYFRIRNERTGEEQTVESRDIRPVKPKVTKESIQPEIDQINERLNDLTPEGKKSVLSLNNNSGSVLIPDFQDLQQAVQNVAQSLNQIYNNFTDWSSEMVKSFGSEIVSFLKRIYNTLNTGGIDYLPGKDNSGSILNPAGMFSKSTRQPFKKLQKEKRYKPEGIWSAAGKWNKQIFDFLGQKERNVSANLNATEFLAAKLQRELSKARKEGLNIETETLNTALGNTDNRLTNEQYAQARQIRNEQDRATFERNAKLENYQRAREAQSAALQSLPENLQQTITEMRNRIDQLSSELRDSGAVSGDIQSSIDDAMGLYLHRSYSIFDNAEGWKNFIHSDDPSAVAIRNRAETLFQDYARADAARALMDERREAGNPISREEAVDLTKNLDVSEEAAILLQDYLSIADKGELSILGGRVPGQKNQSILKMRGQIPEEIRDLWGEQKDATANFAKTYAGMSSFLENHRFLQNVLKEGLITETNPNGYIWKEGESPGNRPLSFVQLAGEGSKSMEPINGAWMDPVLASAFTEYYGNRANNNALLRLAQAATGLSMKSKTAYSLASTIRNFVGNIAFMTSNGNFNAAKLTDAQKSAWSNLTKGGEKQVRDRIENYIRLGVVGDNVGPSLLKEITEAANIEKTGDKLTQSNPILTKIWRGMKKVDRKATDIYSSVDDFWKVFAFENELGKVKKAYPNDTQEQQEKRAADIVRSTVPTYSLAPEVVRDLKSNIGVFFAPFITFTTEVLRTTYNTVKQGVTEIRQGNATNNPELRNIGIKRLSSFAATQGFFYGLALMAKEAFDYDDEDEDAIRKFLPEYQKNAQLILLPPDEKGNPRFIDVSFLDPYGYLKEPVIAAMVQSRSGKSTDQIAKDASLAAVRQVASPFLSEQILAGSIADVARNKKANGGEVYNSQDNIENISAKSAAHIISSFEPGTLTSLKRIYKGVTGQVSPTGRAYDTPSELSSFLLGQRVSSLDPQTSLDFSARKFKGSNQSSTSLFTKDFKSRGTINDDAVENGYLSANEAKKKNIQDLRDAYKAAITLGVPDKKAKLILDDAEIGKDDLREVTSGVYRRYEPSNQSINEVRKTHPERVIQLQKAISETPKTVPLR